MDLANGPIIVRRIGDVNAFPGAAVNFRGDLVGDVLDRIDQFPGFDPLRDYGLTIGENEARVEERAAMAGKSVDE